MSLRHATCTLNNLFRRPLPRPTQHSPQLLMTIAPRERVPAALPDLGARFTRAAHSCFLLVFAAVFPATQLHGQTTYFLTGGADPSVAANWGTSTDGSGAHPANFTTASQIFAIQSAQTAALISAWTVSGSGSKVVVNNGGTLTAADKNPAITLDLASGATYSVTGSYSALNFGTINSGSTFAFGAGSSSFRTSGITYGGLTWQSSSATGTPGTFTTTGNFTIAANTAQVVTTSATSNTWTIGGDATINSGTTLALAPNTNIR